MLYGEIYSCLNVQWKAFHEGVNWVQYVNIVVYNPYTALTAGHRNITSLQEFVSHKIELNPHRISQKTFDRLAVQQSASERSLSLH